MISAGVSARSVEPSALAAYARARIADRANDNAVAVANYSAALTLGSDATLVAFRAYRAGVDGGDYALALRAAQTLDRSGIVPPDAHLLLYIAAVRNRAWAEASNRLDQIGKQDGFDFVEPLFRQWLANLVGAVPKAGKRDLTAYAAESEALLALSAPDETAGVAAIKVLWPTDPYRASTLRLAAAATLVARDKRRAALPLLLGDDPSIAAARDRVLRGKKVSGAIDTPARGASFILARMAADLMNPSAIRSAITIARLSVFADPSSAQARLVAATALGVAGRHNEALSLIDAVQNDPVYADLASSLRIDRLEALGLTDEAVTAATARAARSTNDMTRVADIEVRRGRYAEGVVQYRRAIAKIGENNVSPQLWLALGNALDLSGDWRSARPILERALALAPDDARLLNQLGFGMADRGEDIGIAIGLLNKANAARPDNAAITDSLGWAEFRAGRIDRAVAILERARILDPAEPEIAEHLGDVYWTAGRRIEARYAWTGARATATGEILARIDGKIARGLP